LVIAAGARRAVLLVHTSHLRQAGVRRAALAVVAVDGFLTDTLALQADIAPGAQVHRLRALSALATATVVPALLSVAGREDAYALQALFSALGAGAT